MTVKNFAKALLLCALLIASAAGQTFVKENPNEDGEKEGGTSDGCHKEITIGLHMASHTRVLGPTDRGYMYWYQLKNTKPGTKIRFSWVLAADEAEARKLVAEGKVKTSTLESGAEHNWESVKNASGAYFAMGYVTTEPSATGMYEGCSASANPVDTFCMWNPTEKCANFDKVRSAQASLKNDPQATVIPASFDTADAKRCEPSDPKDPAADLREKVLQILRANAQPISLEEFGGAAYTVTKIDFAVEGNNLVVRFTERWSSMDGFKAAKPEDVSWWKQDLSTTISFEEMAATLKPLQLTPTENKYPYVLSTNVRWLEMGGKRDSQNYEAFKLPGPRPPHHAIPFDMGPAEANYKELAKLLAQLRAASSGSAKSAQPCIASPPPSESKFAALKPAPQTSGPASGPTVAQQGPQPEGFQSTVKGDPGIGRAQQENDQKRQAVTCQSGLDQLEQEFSGITARQPASASTIPLIQTALYMIDKRMGYLEKNCKGQPQYSEYDQLKAQQDQLVKTCQGIATTPAVCVAKLAW